MSLVSRKINTDKEIQDLKKKYKELYGKSAPSFSRDDHSSITEYRNKLKKLIEKASAKM